MSSITEPPVASTAAPAGSQEPAKLWPVAVLAVVLIGVTVLMLLASLSDASAAGGCGGG